jgi:hypothetical protein
MYKATGNEPVILVTDMDARGPEYQRVHHPGVIERSKRSQTGNRYDAIRERESKHAIFF